jgi:hypothetical protein
MVIPQSLQEAMSLNPSIPTSVSDCSDPGSGNNHGCFYGDKHNTHKTEIQGPVWGALLKPRNVVRILVTFCMIRTKSRSHYFHNFEKHAIHIIFTFFHIIG